MSEQQRLELTLNPQQIQRVRAALLNVGPNNSVRITTHPKGIVIETIDTRQRWRIGPRGGLF